METESSVGLSQGLTGQHALSCDADASRAQHQSEDADVSRQVVTALSEPHAAEALDDAPRLQIAAVETPSRQPGLSAQCEIGPGFNFDCQTGDGAAAHDSLEQITPERNLEPVDTQHGHLQEGNRGPSIRHRAPPRSATDADVAYPRPDATAWHDSSCQAELQAEQESHAAQPACAQDLAIDQQTFSQHGADGLAEGEPGSHAPSGNYHQVC